MSENNEKNNDKIKEKQKVSDKDKNQDISTEEKLKETEDKLLRSLAETENQRRRFEKEIKDAFEFGSFNFARESLAILDNLERAKNAIKTDEILKSNKDLDKFLENISIIEKDLISIFEKNNIKPIESLNKKLDPNFHQAMMEIEDDAKEPGTIIQEIQKGFTIKDRLLRPSLVGVSKKVTIKEEKTEENQENQENK